LTNYRLSHRADADLESIAEYGYSRFGADRAHAYYQGLVLQLKQIAMTPLRYPSVEDIRPGYRRCVYKSHSIYYTIGEEVVMIIRVLGAQDVGNSLPSEGG